MEISSIDMLYALQQKNLVYNYDFLYFSNRDNSLYNHPDGWIYENSSPNSEINFDERTGSCIIQKGKRNDPMSFKQYIDEFPRARSVISGQKISAKAVIINPASNNTAFDLSFYISDGSNSDEKTLQFSPGDTREVTIQLLIRGNYDRVSVGIESSTEDAIIYIQKIYANIGEIALESLPCMVQGYIGERKQYIATEIPPAEELSLCEAPKELTDQYTRLNSVLNHRFGKGNTNSMLIDMRGYFSRCWDNGAHVDTDAGGRTEPGTGKVKGDHVSTFEEDAFLKHDHGLNFDFKKPLPHTPGQTQAMIVNTAGTSKTEIEKDKDETRPKNIAELYTIKWA